MKHEPLHTLLRSAGLLSCYTGYQYLVDAVSMAVSEPKKLTDIKREIYAPIAAKHDVSVWSVERDIRTMRDMLMKNGGGKLLCSLTGCAVWESRMPYPREIICIFADYISAQRRPETDGMHP